MKKVEWKWTEIQKLFNEINVCVISEDAFRQRFWALRSGGKSKHKCWFYS